MPYIPENKKAFADAAPNNAGELTYALTRVVDRYIVSSAGDSEIRFEQIAQVLGALEATKLEFSRRVCAPFEEAKRQLNGDVYECIVGLPQP